MCLYGLFVTRAHVAAFILGGDCRDCKTLICHKLTVNFSAKILSGMIFHIEMYCLCYSTTALLLAIIWIHKETSMTTQKIVYLELLKSLQYTFRFLLHSWRNSIPILCNKKSSAKLNDIFGISTPHGRSLNNYTSYRKIAISILKLKV